MDEPSEPSHASAFLPITFLIGGGWDHPAVYDPFLRAAAGTPGSTPHVACVILDEGEGDGERQFARYDEALRSAGDCTPVPVLMPIGARFDVGAAADVDGLLVCGGLTPAYQDAFADCLDRLPRLLAERRIPYAGFSAGAALAARAAVVGGGCSTGSRCARRTPVRTWTRSPYGTGWGWCPSPWTRTRRSGGRCPG